MKRYLTVGMILLSIFAFGYPSETMAAQIIAKFAHALSIQSPYHSGGLKFAELVEKKTDGSIKVDVYAGSLGAERELLEGLSNGTVEFALHSAIIAQSYSPELAVFGLPFLFKDRSEAYRALDGTVAKEIFKKLEPRGIMELEAWEAGFRNIGNSKRPINSLADIKGLKIRVPEGDIYLTIWKALGGNPIPMAWSELYMALQMKVVDAQEVPIANFAATKFYEVQKYYSFINYMYDPIALSISLKFWKTLSAEQQKAVAEAAKEACAYERNLVQEQEQTLEKELVGKGVSFTRPELEPFHNAVKVVYDQYRDKFGDWPNRIKAAATGK
jgi:tripartite ATP-independent transporter DctP family solute receptor